MVKATVSFVVSESCATALVAPTAAQVTSTKETFKVADEAAVLAWINEHAATGAPVSAVKAIHGCELTGAFALDYIGAKLQPNETLTFKVAHKPVIDWVKAIPGTQIPGVETVPAADKLTLK